MEGWIYYRKLAHVIMKAEKAHNLPSAGWSPRRAGVILILVQTRGPETRRARASSGQSTGLPAQAGRKPTLCLCSPRALNGLGDAHPHG